MDGGELLHRWLRHGAPRRVSYTMFTHTCTQTIAAVTAFVLLICRNPDTQRRAQDEIAAVLGSGRLPVLADVPRLPYVGACVKETLRYWTVAPLGIYPHVLLSVLVHNKRLTSLPERSPASRDGRRPLPAVRYPCR